MTERANASLTGAGGVEIFWQSWLPDGEPRAIVVIVHGLGEHSDRYDHVAEALTAQTWAVYAPDHRGHGRSQGSRELIDRVENVVADLDQLVVRAAAAHPDLPVFMLGHSLGGMLAVRYALAHQARLTGLILSGPLAAIEAPPVQRRIGRVLSRVAPRLGVVALDAELVSRDPAVVRAYREDPLVHHGRIPARTAAEMVQTVSAFPEQVGAIMLPTLIVYGTADGLCPPSGSIMLADRIGAEDVTVRAYDGLYHEVLNEPERDAVIADVVGWLAERVARADVGPGAISDR